MSWRRYLPRRAEWRRTLLWALAAGAVVDAAYLAWLWPDWHPIAEGPIPKSRFIADYEERRSGEPELPHLRWRPVPLGTLPDHLSRAVLVAEDSRFFQHWGIDLQAIFDATEANLERGDLVFGASTISQQTAKNLFLTPARTPSRKWHELWLTLGLEWHVEKRRILAIYLNTVELGPGLFGVEAAAQYYFGHGAAGLSPSEAAELAATLPGPLRHNPETRTRSFLDRRDRILELTRRFGSEEPADEEVEPPALEEVEPDAPAEADAPDEDAAEGADEEAAPEQPEEPVTPEESIDLEEVNQ